MGLHTIGLQYFNLATIDKEWWETWVNLYLKLHTQHFNQTITNKTNKTNIKKVV